MTPAPLGRTPSSDAADRPGLTGIGKPLPVIRPRPVTHGQALVSDVESRPQTPTSGPLQIIGPLLRLTS